MPPDQPSGNILFQTEIFISINSFLMIYIGGIPMGCQQAGTLFFTERSSLMGFYFSLRDIQNHHQNIDGNFNLENNSTNF